MSDRDVLEELGSLLAEAGVEPYLSDPKSYAHGNRDGLAQNERELSEARTRIGELEAERDRARTMARELGADVADLESCPPDVTVEGDLTMVVGSSELRTRARTAEDERDAALARIAELEAALQEAASPTLTVGRPRPLPTREPGHTYEDGLEDARAYDGAVLRAHIAANEKREAKARAESDRLREALQRIVDAAADGGLDSQDVAGVAVGVANEALAAKPSGSPRITLSKAKEGEDPAESWRIQRYENGEWKVVDVPWTKQPTEEPRDVFEIEVGGTAGGFYNSHPWYVSGGKWRGNPPPEIREKYEQAEDERLRLNSASPTLKVGNPRPLPMVFRRTRDGEAPSEHVVLTAYNAKEWDALITARPDGSVVLSPAFFEAVRAAKSTWNEHRRCLHCQRDDCPWLRGAPCQAVARPTGEPKE